MASFLLAHIHTLIWTALAIVGMVYALLILADIRRDRLLLLDRGRQPLKQALVASAKRRMLIHLAVKTLFTILGIYLLVTVIGSELVSDTLILALVLLDSNLVLENRSRRRMLLIPAVADVLVAKQQAREEMKVDADNRTAKELKGVGPNASKGVARDEAETDADNRSAAEKQPSESWRVR